MYSFTDRSCFPCRHNAGHGWTWNTDRCPRRIWYLHIGASSCDYVNLSASGSPFERAYIYEEGIVSINELLPTTADTSDPSTFGTGIWFTPGISPGTIYTVNAYKDIGFDSIPVSWGLNFFAPGSPPLDEFGFARAPDMQVLLSSGTGTYVDPVNFAGGWDGMSAVLAYSPTYVPPANAWIGFSWGDGAPQLVRNADGLLVGPRPTDTEFVSTAYINQPGGIIVNPDGSFTVIEPSFSSPTKFTPLYASVAPAGVPELGTWAMMIFGFGLSGLALRRQPLRKASLA